MEALGINLKFLLIQLANFALFTFLFTKFLLNPILKALDDRKRKIAEGLEAAQKSKNELAQIEDVKAEAKKKSKTEEKKLLEEAKVKADKEAVEIILEAKKKADKIIKDAETGLKNMEEQEIKRMREQELKVVEAVIEKILDNKLEGLDVRARYQKAMGELYKEIN
jgi:F-type H+-transporting ATPase subunit b